MKRIAALLSILLTSPAVAEVFECNGTWTTKPCASPQCATPPCVAVTAAPPLTTAQPEDPDRSQKSSMFHELTMKSIRAREQYNVKVELALAERACVRDRQSLESCAAAIKAAEEELDRKIVVAEQLKTQQQAVKAQEDANKLQAERNEIERSKPTVAVVRRPVIIIRPDTEFSDTGFSDTGLRPQVGVGSSVQVQGSLPQGNVSISITENSGYSYPRPGGYHDGGDGRPRGSYHQAPRSAGGQVVALPRPKKPSPNGSKSALSSEER